MKKKIIFSFLFLHLQNRNSLAGLVNFFSFGEKKICFYFSYCFYIYVIETHQIDLYIFSDSKKKIYIFFFLHLCSRNSLAGFVIFFRFEKKIKKFLLLHLCNRNSLAGLVHFFRFGIFFSTFMQQKLISWICTFFQIRKKKKICSYIYVTETHQMDLCIFSLYLCKRNSLEGLVNFFRFEKKNHFFIFFVSTFM